VSMENERPDRHDVRLGWKLLPLKHCLTFAKGPASSQPISLAKEFRCSGSRDWGIARRPWRDATTWPRTWWTASGSTFGFDVATF
jgi:hypothetical protein